MFPKPVSVSATQKYQLFLRFADGTAGTADLSHLAGKGVFRQWEHDDLFFKVALDPETNAIIWNDMLDICSDNLYLQIKGLTFEQFRAESVAHVVVGTADLSHLAGKGQLAQNFTLG